MRKIIRRFFKDDSWEKFDHHGKMCRTIGDYVFMVLLVLWLIASVVLCVYL